MRFQTQLASLVLAFPSTMVRSEDMSRELVDPAVDIKAAVAPLSVAWMLVP